MSCKAAVVWLACAGCAHAATYTTYIGDQFTYQVAAIATDANGSTYVTGSRAVLTPTLTEEAATGNYNVVTDVFVSKLDTSGNLTPIATFGGKGSDQANGIAVDAAGNIYVVGATTSPDFPLHNPLQAALGVLPLYLGAGNQATGFLVKLAADGAVIYSTYLGGTQGGSSLNSVAADDSGNAYVTGSTTASDYPHTTGLPAGFVFPAVAGQGAITGAFFAKINPTGSQIVYAGALPAGAHECVGGSACFFQSLTAVGSSIAVDPAGSCYIAANTNGAYEGTPGALMTSGTGAVITKVNAAGNGLVYQTLLGAGNFEPGVGTVSLDTVSAVAADADGNAYISGSTSDPSFPVTPSAFQTTLGSGPFSLPNVPASNAFVAKLNPTGSAMLWATFLGGRGPDQAQTVAPDSVGNVWVSGTTQSTGFPADFPKTTGPASGSEFLAQLNSDGSNLLYSALFPSNTEAAALAVDAGGTVHAGGATGLISAFPEESAPGQTTAPWLYGISNSAGGVLAGRVAPGELISLYGLHFGSATPELAAFDGAGFLPTILGGVTVKIDGTVAPLLYVSDTQINAIAPVELTAGSAATLNLALNGASILNSRTMIVSAAPQIFRNADGSAAAINQDESLNLPTNPAPIGSYVSVWATGTGYFPGSDGQMATGANSFCNVIIDCEILIWAISPQTGLTTVSQANVSYIGAAPDMVNGVVQINLQNMGPGSYYFSVGGAISDQFSIY